MIETLCVNCPRGCHLKVTENDGCCMVEGNGCEKGREYGIQELHDPRRVLTSTVRLSPSLAKETGLLRLPVISSLPVRKDALRDVSLALGSVVLEYPCRMGDEVCRIGEVAFLAGEDAEVGDEG